MALVVKNPPDNAGDVRDTGLIPELGRFSGGGHGNHSSILAWRIPWTEEPCRLQTIGWHHRLNGQKFELIQGEEVGDR